MIISKYTAIALLAMLSCSQINAQNTVADTIADVQSTEINHSNELNHAQSAENTDRRLSLDYKMHHPSVKSFALPVGLGVASSLFATNGWLRQRRNDLQDWLDTSHKTKTIDNYIQYSPMVAMLGLDFCGVQAQHKVLDRVGLLALSALGVAIMTNGIKYTVKEPRPDGSSHNSFPSGHTATAFMGAELLFQEYHNVSPWIGYSGYLMAAATGALRIYNNRHWVNDVVAGACVGIISVKLAYWLYPIIFSKDCLWRDCPAMIYPSVGNGGGSLCLALKL